jgi:alpha-N-arabinofuranosidase
VLRPDLYSWNRTILEAAREPIPVGYDRLPPFDYISCHAYCVPPVDPDYYTLMALPAFFENHTRLMRGEIMGALRSVRPWVKIAWDEWNLFGWFVWTDKPEYDDNSAYTLEHALFTALMLNAFQRNGDTVAMANFSPPINMTGMIYTHPQGIVLRPPYVIFDLYANTCGSLALDTWCSCDSYDCVVDTNRAEIGLIPLYNVGYLDASATLDPEGRRLAIAVVNRHRDAALPATIELSGFPSGKAELHAVYHDEVSAHNDITSPHRIAISRESLGTMDEETTIEFPPHSVCLLELHMD